MNNNGIETQVVELKRQIAILYPMARRTAWAAYCWNDHNFDLIDLHTLAIKDAKKSGIESLNDWNEFCNEVDGLEVTKV